MTIVIASQLQETSKEIKIKLNSSAVKKNYQLKWQTIGWLILICLINSARWMSTSFFALYVTMHLHQQSFVVGIFYSVIALVLVFSTQIFGMIIYRVKNEYIIYRTFIWMVILAASAQCLYAFANYFFAAFFAGLLWGASLGAISVLSLTLLLKVPAKLKIKVVGLNSSVTKLGNLLGVAMGAIIYAQ